MLLLLVIIGIALYVIVILIKDYLSFRDFWFWLALLSAIGIIGFILYDIICVVQNRIIMVADKIIVPGNKGERKIQYEIHIQYVDIKNIYLTSSKKDSKGRSVFGVFVQMPYIIFEEYSGEVKAVNVYNYSKKKVAQIIDIIIDEANNRGNRIDINSGLELIKNFKANLKK